MLRDRESYELLLNNRVDKEKIVVVPDIAFYLANHKIKKKRTQIKNVLITALDWSWGVELHRKNDYDKIISKYKENLARIIDYLCDEMDVKVSIFPHVTVDTSNDLIISNEILKITKTSKKIDVILKSESHIDEILKLYSNFDLVIGSRMHSCILALSQGVPTIGVAYQPKTFGTFNLLGIPEYAVDGNSFEFSELKDLVVEINEKYSDTVDLFITKSEKTYKMIEDEIFTCI
jgi:colanic acid/amylovoran biosynthesis protein